MEEKNEINYQKLPIRIILFLINDFFELSLKIKSFSEEEVLKKQIDVSKINGYRKIETFDITSWPPDEVTYEKDMYQMKDFYGIFKVDKATRTVFQIFTNFRILRNEQLKSIPFQNSKGIYSRRIIFDDYKYLENVMCRFKRLTSFGKIDLMSNDKSLSFQIFDMICKNNCESLETISCSVYHYMNRCFESLNKLKKLKELNLEVMYFSKLDVELKLNQLRRFNLEDNKSITEHQRIPYDFDFNKLNRLTSVTLSHSKINSFHINCLNELKLLISIAFDFCELDNNYYILFMNKRLKNIKILYSKFKKEQLNLVELTKDSNLKSITIRINSDLPCKFIKELKKLEKLAVKL